jgi:hypothetical protein
MSSQSHHSTPRRRFSATVAALAIGSAGLFGTSPARAAEEQLNFGDFVGAIFKAYDIMSKGLNLLKKPNDPFAPHAAAIVAEINEAEQNILNQLRHQLFLQQLNGQISYKSKVQTVQDRFEVMSAMLTNNGQLPQLRTLTQTLSDETLTFFDIQVQEHPEIEVSYQLAPSFNLLLSTHTPILHMAGEINVNDTMPIVAYSQQLRRGLNVNYRLVGARDQACGGLWYPPTRDAYFIGTTLDGRVGALQAPYKANTYKQSALYKKKFSNTWYDIRSNSGFWYSCNPMTRRCIVPSGVGGTPGEQSCDNPSSANFKPILASCLSRADNLVSQTFNADTTVGGIRESMLGIMKLGLVRIATPGGAFPGTSLAQGAYFDPWVVNTPCGVHPATGRPSGAEYMIRP